MGKHTQHRDWRIDPVIRYAYLSATVVVVAVIAFIVFAALMEPAR